MCIYILKKDVFIIYKKWMNKKSVDIPHEKM